MAMARILALLLMLAITGPTTELRAEAVTLNFKEAEIGSVIDAMARITGRTFLVDPAVRGNITVISSKPLSADEVYAVFLSILRVHDFAAVEAGKVTKIIPVAKASQDLVLTDDGKSTARLPDDRIITRIHRLHNLQADKLVPILRPLLNTNSGQTSALAVKEGNTLIFTDRAGNVERLLQIVRRLDQASGGGLEMLRLEHADAREVVAVISGLELTSGRLSADQLRMAADARTNSILLQGDEEHLLRVKAMILHLDTPLAQGGDTQVVFLRYANAKDLVGILTGMELPEAARPDGSAPQSRTVQQRPDVNIQADENTNALIMTGPPAVIQSLQGIIRQLDIRRTQLMIEAVIAEVSTDQSVNLGVQWFGADTNMGAVSTNFPGSGVGINGLAMSDEKSITALAGVSGLSLGFFSGTAELFGKQFFNFGALINALGSNSDTNILSTPSLVTMDNQVAEIIVGQNVPFLTGSFSTATTGGNPFQTIERRDVGIKLRVKPQVNEGDIIRLDIEQEVSGVETNSAAYAAGTGSGLITNTRSIKTSVLVEDGKVLVLGGLISDDVQETVNKVLLLGDIPILGALFRHTGSKKVKRNLMVFLRPVILRDQTMSRRVALDKYDLIRQQQLGRDQDGVKLMPEERQPVLPDFNVFEEQHSYDPPPVPPEPAASTLPATQEDNPF